uniref:Myelin and lymphocyte protein n=1 Tax=Sander lucioperca TaxID=283035 RepID=A0A8C9YGJ9_SANLU
MERCQSEGAAYRKVPEWLAVWCLAHGHLGSAEEVFGGLVWMLVASAELVVFPNPLGWVMFVSVFCFVSGIWPSLVRHDVGYHFVAVVFYLSASVILAYVTLLRATIQFLQYGLKTYRLDIAAVVMSYVATILYFIHAIFSAIRWKRS